MADEGSTKQQEQNLEIRRALSDAYAFIEGQKAAQSFAALTYEDLADQQIELIEGTGVRSRPNKLARIDRTENDLLSAIDKIGSLPPEAFARPSPDNDVNSPVDDE